jgi:hypothetical protein
VSHRGPVHADVIIVTKVYELFSGELSVVVSNDGIGYPKTKNVVLDKIYGLLGADFG